VIRWGLRATRQIDTVRDLNRCCDGFYDTAYLEFNKKGVYSSVQEIRAGQRCDVCPACKATGQDLLGIQFRLSTEHATKNYDAIPNENPRVMRP
jgi:hypothetical protein